MVLRWYYVVGRNIGFKIKRWMIREFPFKVEVRRKRGESIFVRNRFEYQQRYVDFESIGEGRVLDVGCSSLPFKYADVALDRDGKPMIKGDVHNLPFRDNCFGFVYCSHVLEHVENPVKACEELIRVGKKGYIELPTLMKDALCVMGSKAKHRWHVVGVGRNLCFFEYTKRQLEGVRSEVFNALVCGKWLNPMQGLYWDNQDIFNIMFEWEKRFGILVFYLDGRIEDNRY